MKQEFKKGDKVKVINDHCGLMPTFKKGHVFTVLKKSDIPGRFILNDNSKGPESKGWVGCPECLRKVKINLTEEICQRKQGKRNQGKKKAKNQQPLQK